MGIPADRADECALLVPSFAGMTWDVVTCGATLDSDGPAELRSHP
ncbi:MAG: hypothetical protein R3B13_15700 [Polyangiaceae bacterium]